MAKSVTRAIATTLALGAGLYTFAAPAQAAEPAPGQTQASTQQAKDLTVGYTVSSWKATGYAGTVAIHAKNVGTERYYGDFPLVSCKGEVKTASGPQGVDRLITPRGHNGAYVRDLGFDEKTSTRTFMVTLSNPVNAADSDLIATLDFGDGNTSEGRMKNYIEVTQVGRVAGDTSSANDQHVDSRTNTVTDFGNKNTGLF